MDWIKWANEIHENAVGHGWWNEGFWLAIAAIYIRDWLAFRGIDMEKIIALKHEYNKDRPYRHGGKKI